MERARGGGVRRTVRRRRHRGGSRAAGVHDAAPGVRAAARDARRGQHVGQGPRARRDRDRPGRAVREGERVGHGDDRAARPPRGATRSPSGAGGDRRPVRRGHGEPAAPQPARLEGAKPVRGDAPARVGAAHVHRPHARERGARPHGPAARRRDLPRGLRRPRRDRALHHARLRPREGREGGGGRPPGGGRTRPPQARAVHVWGHGAGGVRTHDRVGEPRRSPHRARAWERVCRCRDARGGRLRERDRACHPRHADEPAARRGA